MKAIVLVLALALAAPGALAQSSGGGGGGGGGSSGGGGGSSGGGGSQSATGALSSGRMGSDGMVPRDATPSERTATGAIANERMTDEGVPLSPLRGNERTATGAIADDRLTGSGMVPRDIPPEAFDHTEPGVRDSGQLGELPDGGGEGSPVLGGPRETSPLDRPLDLPR